MIDSDAIHVEKFSGFPPNTVLNENLWSIILGSNVRRIFVDYINNAITLQNQQLQQNRTRKFMTSLQEDTTHKSNKQETDKMYLL